MLHGNYNLRIAIEGEIDIKNEEKRERRGGGVGPRGECESDAISEVSNVSDRSTHGSRKQHSLTEHKRQGRF